MKKMNSAVGGRVSCTNSAANLSMPVGKTESPRIGASCPRRRRPDRGVGSSIATTKDASSSPNGIHTLGEWRSMCGNVRRSSPNVRHPQRAEQAAAGGRAADSGCDGAGLGGRIGRLEPVLDALLLAGSAPGCGAIGVLGACQVGSPPGNRQRFWARGWYRRRRPRASEVGDKWRLPSSRGTRLPPPSRVPPGGPGMALRRSGSLLLLVVLLILSGLPLPPAAARAPRRGDPGRPALPWPRLPRAGPSPRMSSSGRS